jgi:CubicO group peptidase (beta-lactamase class C family)
MESTIGSAVWQGPQKAGTPNTRDGTHLPIDKVVYSRSEALRNRTRKHSPADLRDRIRVISSRLAIGAAFLLIGTDSSAQQAGLEQVNQFVTREMSRKHIPGLSIAIVRNGRVLLRRGYGYANVELGVAASDSTVYQSGSLGKQFTAALVGMLAEQGRLSLDDKIVKWFPEGSDVWQRVTVRHLLTHTSGIAEYTDSTFDYRKDYTEDQLVKFAASRPLDFLPGDRWSYSNTGYLLLGVLIHRATGRFYGDLLHGMLFSPLGMRQTRIISEADIVPNRSAGYEMVKGRLKNQEWVSPSLNTTADGSLYFSINDLIQWANSLDQRRIPDTTVLRLAWSPVRLNDGGLYPYGFGWDLVTQRGYSRIAHTGSWQGFKTALYRYPEFNLTVIVLANLAQAQPGAMAEAIAGLLEPALAPAQQLSTPLSGPRPPQPLEQQLARIAAGSDTSAVTPGLRRFLSPAWRRDLEQTLAPARSWRSLGCDDLAGRAPEWLGSSFVRECYAVATNGDEGIVASVFYTRDWQVGHFEVSLY